MDLRTLRSCAHPLKSAPNDAALRSETIAMLRRFNMRAVASGAPAVVREWRTEAPDLIIPALTAAAPLDSVPAMVRRGDAAVLGELAFQYAGVGPGDSLPERWIALGERLDVPIAIHVGPGPPGAPYVGAPRYRMRLSNPLLLEDVFVRHPRGASM